LADLSTLAQDEKPFFLAVGLIRPHLPFGAPARYMEPYIDAELPTILPVKPEGRSTWHRSGEFMKYHRWDRDPNQDPDFALEVRRHYAASVSYADAQVGRILDRLAALGLDSNTIVVLWGDHGWHLGEHAIWGKHSLFEESLWAPLIIRTPDMPFPGKRSREIAESIDLYPTLSQLAGLAVPDRLDGQPLLSELLLPVGEGGHAISYWSQGRVTIRTDRYRLIAHADGFLELYDHRSPEKEARNIATESPETALRLLRMIEARVPTKLSDALQALAATGSR
jgi:iduronate 2-sulfatase